MWSTAQAWAHVEYVVVPDPNLMGSHWPFFINALLDPLMIIIIAVTGLVVWGVWHAITRYSASRGFLTQITKRAAGYDSLIGWMLRLSLGIALLGAGMSHTIISPAVGAGAFPLISVLEFAMGFCLLLGFLIEPITLLAIGIYIIGLVENMYLLGNLEFLGAAVALLMAGDTRPGLDHILGIRNFSSLRYFRQYLPLVLRISFGASLIFLAVYEKLLNPLLSAKVVIAYHLTTFIPVSIPLWVLGVALVEITLGFLLVIGFYTRLVAAITFAVLTASFFFFGESVYAHVVIFGVLSVLFVTGSGRLAVDRPR